MSAEIDSVQPAHIAAREVARGYIQGLVEMGITPGPILLKVIAEQASARALKDYTREMEEDLERTLVVEQKKHDARVKQEDARRYCSAVAGFCIFLSWFNITVSGNVVMAVVSAVVGMVSLVVALRAIIERPAA